MEATLWICIVTILLWTFFLLIAAIAEKIRFRNRNRYLGIALMFCLFPPSLSHAGNWQFVVLGVNVNKLDEVDLKTAALGAVASIVVHELGHVVCAKLQGADVGIDILPTPEVTWEKDGRFDRAMFGRAGFALQTLVGVMLPAGDFRTGWWAMETFESASYLARPSHGDTREIDFGGGHPELEMSLYHGLSKINLFNCVSVKQPEKTPAKPVTF